MGCLGRRSLKRGSRSSRWSVQMPSLPLPSRLSCEVVGRWWGGGGGCGGFDDGGVLLGWL